MESIPTGWVPHATQSSALHQHSTSIRHRLQHLQVLHEGKDEETGKKFPLTLKGPASSSRDVRLKFRF